MEAEGTLPNSIYEAIITLITKPDKRHICIKFLNPSFKMYKVHEQKYHKIRYTNGQQEHEK